MLYDDLEKMDVVSSDGNILGKVDGVVLHDKWKIKGLTVKIDNDDIKELGKKKPFLSALKLDINKDLIDGIKDTVLLSNNLKELGKLFTTHDKKHGAERMLGLEIMGKDGKLIGKVVDIKIDIKKWIVPSITIKVKKDSLKLLKMDDGFLSDKKISLSTDHIKEIGKDYVMLKITGEDLGDLLESNKT